MKKYLFDFIEALIAEKGCSLKTEEAYQKDIEQFLALEHIKNPSEITPQKISDFVALLAKRFYAPKSQARKLSAIREFCRFLFSEDIIAQNPATDIDSPKQEKTLPKFLNENEMSALISQAKKNNDFRHRRISAMLILMYHCGLRISEIIALPINNINFKKNQVVILGKGAKERLLPVSETAVEEIKNYLDIRHCFTKDKNNKWLFPSLSAKDGHITRDSFYKHLKDLAVQAGISPSRVTPHVLRHSFATQLLNHDADLRSVQKMLGHESIGTTEIYTHILSEDLIKTVQNIHPLSHHKK